jgi:hypothetical protein
LPQSIQLKLRKHYRLCVVGLMAALFLARCGFSSTPRGVDVRPITSLKFTARPDFLNRVQRQLGGDAADWSKNGFGYLVYRLPRDGDTPIFRNIEVYLEDNLKKQYVYDDFRSVQEVYAHMRQVFTTPGPGQNWKLYREQDAGAEKWFISFQEAHFATNHGMPMWWDNSPDICIGVLKQNVFIEISYSASFPSRDWSYTRSINKDILFAADVLYKAAL